jgi:hypothetical protein
MKKKQKRVPLSMIRLYKLAQICGDPNNYKAINFFLKFINEHKNDIL